MASITFQKMVASGNDFIVIDNRKGVIRDPRAFSADVCRPHVRIGADGVLLIEPSKYSDFFLRIFNADGSEAEACGNGFRCVGLYAHRRLGFTKVMRIETLSGEVEVAVKENMIRVKMADPKDYREPVVLAGLAAPITASFINTGVPHAVIFTDNVSSTPVHELGRAIRYHELFQPNGTNVDFVEVGGQNSISVRTYERGVEAETLSCGTGATAGAVVAHLTKRVSVPVKVKTKSGEVLHVDLENTNGKIRNVYLEGGAEFVFEGRIGEWN
ncbi:MAG: diaminopimelate epimerase [Omnitrophica bacterium RIFCSPLOWO2_12_FULL_50_11]|nr:MAG: diaminopimelate epimerase [Omnitrophica bacterium RIFCSPLOWO2_12_FULL_50_11]